MCSVGVKVVNDAVIRDNIVSYAHTIQAIFSNFFARAILFLLRDLRFFEPCVIGYSGVQLTQSVAPVGAQMRGYPQLFKKSRVEAEYFVGRQAAAGVAYKGGDASGYQRVGVALE